MRTQLEIGWGDPQDPSYVYVSEPSAIPGVGDSVSVDERDTDGTVLAYCPTLIVRERSFTFYGTAAARRLEVQLWCEET